MELAGDGGFIASRGLWGAWRCGVACAGGAAGAGAGAAFSSGIGGSGGTAAAKVGRPRLRGANGMREEAATRCEDGPGCARSPGGASSSRIAMGATRCCTVGTDGGRTRGAEGPASAYGRSMRRGLSGVELVGPACSIAARTRRGVPGLKPDASSTCCNSRARSCAGRAGVREADTDASACSPPMPARARDLRGTAYSIGRRTLPRRTVAFGGRHRLGRVARLGAWPPPGARGRRRGTRAGSVELYARDPVPAST